MKEEGFTTTYLRDVFQPLGSEYLENNGLRPFFEKVVKHVPFFNETEEARLTSMVQFAKRHLTLPTLAELSETDEENPVSLLLSGIRVGNGSEMLRIFAAQIHAEALAGNMQFFMEISKAHQKFLRDPKGENDIQYLLIQYWTYAFLFLMDYETVSAHLSRFLNFRIEPNTIGKYAKKLKLLRYSDFEKSPVITGLKDEGFPYQLNSSWTNLHP